MVLNLSFLILVKWDRMKVQCERDALAKNLPNEEGTRSLDHPVLMMSASFLNRVVDLDVFNYIIENFSKNDMMVALIFDQIHSGRFCSLKKSLVVSLEVGKLLSSQ